ncbi:hypothetical protein D3C72_1822150 [compost metagenome]
MKKWTRRKNFLLFIIRQNFITKILSSRQELSSWTMKRMKFMPEGLKIRSEITRNALFLSKEAMLSSLIRSALTR